MTKWEDLFKIRIANPDESFQKHEIVKLLVVMKILKKHTNKTWIRIYTEFRLENGNKVDVYFEDIKNKAIYLYEIQKNMTNEWIERKAKQYDSYEVPYMKSTNFIPIPLKNCPDNVFEINKWLEEYIF